MTTTSTTTTPALRAMVALDAAARPARRRLPIALVALVTLTFGATGFLFALLRDPATAWTFAVGGAGVFALDLWADR